MGNDVKQPLAEENLGLVHLCANRFRGRGIEYDDLALCIVGFECAGDGSSDQSESDEAER